MTEEKMANLILALDHKTLQELRDNAYAELLNIFSLLEFGSVKDHASHVDFSNIKNCCNEAKNV